jgi:glucan endo-1,3-alpha-glucosidase
VVNGAERYVAAHSHSAFRAVLPYLIAAYKAGSLEVNPPGPDTAIAWYRTAAVQGCKHEGELPSLLNFKPHPLTHPGTVWGQGGTVSATHGTRDVISVMAVTKGPASLTVTVGDSLRMSFDISSPSPVSYFEVPFDRYTTGVVTLTLNGRWTKGPEIRDGSQDSKVSCRRPAPAR